MSHDLSILKRALAPLALCALLPLHAAGLEGTGWNISAGLGVGQRPKYLGSDETETKLLPYASVDYRGIVGLGRSHSIEGYGLYFRPIHIGVLKLGLLAAWTPEREESDANALAGMGDRRSNTFVGAEAIVDLGNTRFSLEALKGTRDDAGIAAALSASQRYPLREKLQLRLEATAVWGDDDHMAWDFGITPEQAAARRRLRAAGNRDLHPADGQPYRPSAGFSQAKLGAALEWSVTDHWAATGLVSLTRLLGDAADSPLTREKNLVFVGATMAYRF